MNRIDRLTAILLKLQSKRRITAEEIAEHFDISIRTVYRDLKALGEAGVPIGAEQGSGYFIVDGYYIPPVMFTRDEASAILLAGKLIEKQTDHSVRQNYESALLKIRSVLRSGEKDFLQNLEPYIEVLKPLNNKDDDFPDHFLADINNALVDHKVLQFEYYSNYRDAYTSRQVEPLGLCFYSGHWHLIAYCRMREGTRDFRTDRIMKLTVLDENFDHTKYGNYMDYVTQAVPGGELKEVKLRMSKMVSRFINEQKFYHGFVHQEEEGDNVIMTFITGELNYMARWILMFGKEASVIEPYELSEIINDLIFELTSHYKNHVPA